MQAYCVKCRAKKEMKDAKAITMKRRMVSQQLRVYALHVAQRCLELGRAEAVIFMLVFR